MLQPQMQQQPPQPQMLQPQMQQQPPQQPQFGGYSQMLQPTSYDYMSPAPYPGGAPTFVVDTSDIHPHQERRTTQRQGRQKAPLTAGGEQVSTQRITIRKLG